MGSAGFTGQSQKGNQQNSYDLKQTYMFNPDQMKGLQDSVYGSAMGQLGSVDWSNPGSWLNGVSLGGGSVGGVGRAGYDKATAGKFTEEFDPIMEKLTKGPMVQKALASYLDPISEQAVRSREKIAERAAQRGVLDSGGEVRAEILNQDQADRLKQGARSQAYLGTLGQATHATENQVNAITQANAANAGASAQTAAAYMGANAQVKAANAGIMAAGIGARAGLLGNMMELPYKYAQLLGPTYSNDRLTGQRTSESSKGMNLGIGKK